jgi:predicted nucleotidyltransferase
MHLQESKITTLLEKALREKSATIEPESIILFGSFAKGNYTESSDVDILIVLKSDLDWFDRQLLVSGLDAIIYTPEELERMFYENKGFILDVLEDGIVLHDKGYWKAMKREFLDKKKSGTIKKIKNGWKICTG